MPAPPFVSLDRSYPEAKENNGICSYTAADYWRLDEVDVLQACALERERKRESTNPDVSVPTLPADMAEDPTHLHSLNDVSRCPAVPRGMEEYWHAYCS